uniref:Leucine rich repeat protein n=1 Tax=Marseillevirus LCMAC102 TaxID=2506603 RepID=A0A481YTC2_9VIRU|nr:MAG: leucine rich repeat protein [Marseillevirus LCMAC102]
MNLLAPEIQNVLWGIIIPMLDLIDFYNLLRTAKKLWNQRTRLDLLSLQFNTTHDIPQLEKIPEEWIRRIHTLDMPFSHNIKDINVLAKCTNLCELYIYCNNIEDISALGNCKNLRVFKAYSSLCSRTKIKDISVFGDCKNLYYLDISAFGNCKDISALGNCKNLYHLNIGFNKVEDISALGNCKNLYHLNIGFNKVEDISALGNCKNLYYLDILGNKIKDISTLGNCKNLYHLDISSNKIKDISALENCKNLYHLSTEFKIFRLTEHCCILTRSKRPFILP